MFLGIDIGTSGVKALVIDESNAIIAQAASALSVSRPAPGWSEQNPKDWWAATNMAVNQLPSAVRQAVSAIGLSGQMHGATLLDEADQPLRPAILWNDGRSQSQCQTLKHRLPDIETITGNLVMPGFTAPKLVWVREHERELFDAVRTVLLPKDYVRLRMTGTKASDMSDSAGTSWLDVSRRNWSEDALAACDLTDRHMPSLHEGSEVTGELRQELAEAWGMPCVPVVAGGGDNAAGAVGVGVVDEGQAFLSLGTSGVLFLAGDAFRPFPERGVHAFCHALPNRWHQMTVMLSAASCVDWAARMTGASDPAGLIEAAEREASFDNGLVFLPYLSGERTPHNDPTARGALIGLDHDSDEAAIGQAVLEGVAFAFADGLSALRETGASLSGITVIGGGARSRYWGRILAAVLDEPLNYRAGSEYGPAFGAAKLARLGTTSADEDGILAPAEILDVIEPARRDREMLAAKSERFQTLYSQLKGHFGG